MVVQRRVFNAAVLTSIAIGLAACASPVVQSGQSPRTSKPASVAAPVEPAEPRISYRPATGSLHDAYRNVLWRRRAVEALEELDRDHQRERFVY